MNSERNLPDDSAGSPASAKEEKKKAKKAKSGRARRFLTKTIFYGLILYALVAVGLGVYWSWQPEPFDVGNNALERVGGDPAKLAPGATTVAAIAEVATTLLDKPGGYLSNDLMPPGLLMDNMPSWESGVLKEVRDSARALRNDFSRSQSQSIENKDLRAADSSFNFTADSWALPATESQYREGIEALRQYLDALVTQRDRLARFYTRADNLVAYMVVVEKRLGSFAQRLSASVGDAELTAALVPQQEATDQADALRVKTPWNEIDDVFYEARGYCWALLHIFRALAEDFDDVLSDKNAEFTVQQVIRDLEEATVRMWSPLVLNGSGFGLVNNHSLVLASYMSRANAAVIDLRVLLQQG